MRVFIDTSAFLAIIDRDDEHHSLAAQTWIKLIENDELLFTSNYVLLETYSLLQSRLGMRHFQEFHDYFLPLLNIRWVSEEIHQDGMNAMLMANRRRLSLVDCVSLTVCRDLNVQVVFAFDPHFSEHGYQLLDAGQ